MSASRSRLSMMARQPPNSSASASSSGSRVEDGVAAAPVGDQSAAASRGDARRPGRFDVAPSSQGCRATTASGSAVGAHVLDHRRQAGWARRLPLSMAITHGGRAARLAAPAAGAAPRSTARMPVPWPLVALLLGKQAETEGLSSTSRRARRRASRGCAAATMECPSATGCCWQGRWSPTQAWLESMKNTLSRGA